MKQRETYIIVKLCDILNAPNSKAWEQMCEKYAINEECLNEEADLDDVIQISLEDAQRWGFIEAE